MKRKTRKHYSSRASQDKDLDLADRSRKKLNKRHGEKANLKELCGRDPDEIDEDLDKTDQI